MQHESEKFSTCPHGFPEHLRAECRECSVQSEEPKEERRELPVEQRILGDLGLTWEDLKGKRVLDVGAGLGELAEEGKKHDVKIVSLERFPENYSEEGVVPKDLPYAAGDAKAMPFAEKSFDLIVSHAAPPSISTSPEEVEAVLQEVKRVLKDDGEFRFGPGHLTVKSEEDEPEGMEARQAWLAKKSLERIRSLNWDAELHEREDSSDLFRSYYVLRKQQLNKGLTRDKRDA